MTDFRLLHTSLCENYPGILLPNPVADSSDVSPNTLHSFLLTILTSSRCGGLRAYADLDGIVDSPSVTAFLYDTDRSFAAARRRSLQKPPSSSHRRNLSDVPDATTATTPSPWILDFLPSCISPQLFSNRVSSAMASCGSPRAKGAQQQQQRQQHIANQSSNSMLQSALVSRSAVHPPSNSDHSSSHPPDKPPFDKAGHDSNDYLLDVFNLHACFSSSLSASLSLSLLLEKERAERWKIFAVSLTALANLERLWGHVADKTQRRNQEDMHRSVENSLYLLARAKSDQFVPALERVRSILAGVDADLDMIPTAEAIYGELKRQVPASSSSDARRHAEIKYDVAGARLSDGLHDLNEHSLLGFGRLAYSFLTMEEENANLSSLTANGVIGKLKQHISGSGGGDEMNHFSCKDDKKEVEVLKEVLSLGNSASSAAARQYLSLPYHQRFLNANVQELMRIALDDLDASRTLHTQDTIDYFSSDTGLSAEMAEYTRFAAALRDNAMKCVEAVGCLAQPVVVEGVKLDTETSRLHYLRGLFAFLQVGGVVSPEDLADAEAHLVARCAAERQLLAAALASLSKFNALVDGIQSFVNVHLVASSIELECELRRTDINRVLEGKNELQLRISAAAKKKEKALVLELKQELAAIDDGTSVVHVRAAKDRHKRSKDLRGKLEKLAKKRLLSHLAHKQQVKIADIVSEWAASEARSCPISLQLMGQLRENVLRTLSGSV
jgi:hypothetical protein